MRRVRQAVLDLKKRNDQIWLNEELGTMESTGRAIVYYPGEFRQRVELFKNNYANLPTILKSQGLDANTVDWFLNEIMWNDKK